MGWKSNEEFHNLSSKSASHFHPQVDGQQKKKNAFSLVIEEKSKVDFCVPPKF